ncbi:MAG: ribbon-helix-helix domain-containing protein [Pseudomonadota bacterium]|nr:ribbon-helix-helix domain-containing protein [Pseudomonadota bacterium]
MRTTLTLDDDVAATLECLRRSREDSLKVLVNEALRRGLQQLNKRPEQRHPFRTTAVALGHCHIGSVDYIADVLALAEGDAFN